MTTTSPTTPNGRPLRHGTESGRIGTQADRGREGGWRPELERVRQAQKASPGAYLEKTRLVREGEGQGERLIEKIQEEEGRHLDDAVARYKATYLGEDSGRAPS